jgi:hypothetical protein
LGATWPTFWIGKKWTSFITPPQFRVFPPIDGDGIPSRSIRIRRGRLRPDDATECERCGGRQDEQVSMRVTHEQKFLSVRVPVLPATGSKLAFIAQVHDGTGRSRRTG